MGPLTEVGLKRLASAKRTETETNCVKEDEYEE